MWEPMPQQGDSFSSLRRFGWPLALDAKWGLYALLALLGVTLGMLAGHGDLYLSLGALGLALSLWSAWKAPNLAIVLVLLTTGAYQLLHIVSWYDPYALDLGRGLSVSDLFLIAMAVVATFRLAHSHTRRRLGLLLFAPVACFALWLAVEAIRNYPSVGLSAPGELRTRYLILILPLFAAVSLRDSRAVKSALHVFVFVTVALPILCAPLVVFLNGWQLGSDSNVYNAHIDMGLLMGLLVLWNCSSWVRWPKPLLYLATAVGGMGIVSDAHRSVWVAAILSIAVLWFSRRGFELTLRRALVLLLVALAATLLQLFTPLRVWDTVISRGGAVLTLQDTAMWRAYVQREALRLFVDSPVTGQGLGLYWNTWVPEFGMVISVFPHSLYVMVLVHLGAVGAVLLAWLGLATWRTLARPLATLATLPKNAPVPRQLSVMGMACLLGLAGYGTAYGFEAYSLLLLGICLAGVLPRSSIREARVKA